MTRVYEDDGKDECKEFAMTEEKAEKYNPVEAEFTREPIYRSRRSFVQLSLVVLGVAWLGSFFQKMFFPRPKVEEAKPVEIAAGELPVGSAKELTYGGSPAIVIREAERLSAFSLVCTHLACTVQWQPDKKEFYCPCHDGRFDQFGEVIAGPPPLPLEQLPVQMDGDRIIVGEVA